jgi:hypothetical protein
MGGAVGRLYGRGGRGRDGCCLGSGRGWCWYAGEGTRDPEATPEAARRAININNTTPPISAPARNIADHARPNADHVSSPYLAAYPALSQWFLPASQGLAVWPPRRPAPSAVKRGPQRSQGKTVSPYTRSLVRPTSGGRTTGGGSRPSPAFSGGGLYLSAIQRHGWGLAAGHG